jgi:hypothetical protein
MKRSWLTYCGLGSIGIISLVSAIIWVEPLIRSTAGVAFFTALIGIVVQLVRDDAAYKREIEKADRAEERAQVAADRAEERKLAAHDRETRFTLGVSSHMAKVAFDKHVAFCEEYAAAADKALVTIFREGPTHEGVELAGTLFGVRRSHAVWITAEIDKRLEEFEQLFREMGASAGYVRSTRDTTAAEQRDEHIQRMYKNLSTLTGSSVWDGEKLDEDKAVVATIYWLRQVLGTEEMNAMRQIFIRRAVDDLEIHDATH